MNPHPIRGLAASLLPLAMIVAGCGGGSSSGDETAATAASATAAAATVATRTVVGYGRVLATSSGRPLYLLSSDPAGGSKCTGSCASKWPPLTARGAPTAGPAVQPALLSTFKRDDGTEQVLYDRHALYTHRGRGLTSGAGLKGLGGYWYFVSPTGEAIKSTAGSGY